MPKKTLMEQLNEWLKATEPLIESAIQQIEDHELWLKRYDKRIDAIQRELEWLRRKNEP